MRRPACASSRLDAAIGGILVNEVPIFPYAQLPGKIITMALSVMVAANVSVQTEEEMCIVPGDEKCGRDVGSRVDDERHK